MASDPAVQPLRISKTTPSSSPKKAGPLSEIGAGSQRRNSPSFHQASRKLITSRDSSSLGGLENSAPFSTTSPAKKSAHEIWAARENVSPSRFDSESSLLSRSPSPGVASHRRPSVERLMNAGRVRGSNIFALESKDVYDPSSLPMVDRPSANISPHVASNTFHRFDSLRKEHNPLSSGNNSPAQVDLGHARRKTETDLRPHSSSKLASSIPLPLSPEKFDCARSSPSPTKSAIARNSMFGASFDPELGAWSDGDDNGHSTPRPRSAHQKNVTFDTEHTINEYEEQTPEPSMSTNSREGSWDTEELEQEDYSFDRGSSADVNDSFDEDLENADKTPVVLPEHWSRMSPDEARMDLVDAGDDVFEGSPEPMMRPVLGRSESVASDGSTRPLPPLPAKESSNRDSNSLAAAAERASRLSAGLPRPPPRASCSKDEILSLTKKTTLTTQQHTNSDMTHDESLISHGSVYEVAEEFVIKNLDTGEKREYHIQEKEINDDSVFDDLKDFAAPRISRESILKKVRNTKYDFEDDASEAELSQTAEDTRPSYAQLAKYDPDHPIPSRENSRESSDNNLVNQDYDVSDVEIKDEPVDHSIVDMAAIPEAIAAPRSPSRMDAYEGETSVLHHAIYDDDDEEATSKYSSAEPEPDNSELRSKVSTPTPEHEGKETLDQAMGLLSVRDYSEKETPVPTDEEVRPNSFLGLPTYLSTDDYDFGMKDYITPSPPANNETVKPAENIRGTPAETVTYSSLPAPNAPFTQEASRGSLDSVIYNPAGEYEEPVCASNEPNQEPVSPIADPVIPERRSTIKTSGKLKTRPSASRQDLEALRQQLTDDAEGTGANNAGTEQPGPTGAPLLEGKKSSNHAKKMSITLDIGSEAGEENGLGSLDKEFDRVIETQKKGYVTRESAKVVVASRNFSNETATSEDLNKPTISAPRPVSREGSKAGTTRKPSAEQWIKTESWNGKARRKSQRIASVQAAATSIGPAPPMPGQESALGVVEEDYVTGATGALDEELADGVERGRLFVKVVGVKDLDLPLPKNDRVYFQLTLDNGLHCVTTANLELGRSALIGQEFELVVLNDLEFQLTLTTQLPPAPKPAAEVEVPAPRSPSKSPTKAKQSAFSRLLATPKRRAERERQEREAQEAEERKFRENQRKRASLLPTVWDSLRELVNAADGSFARSYVNLAEHEHGCFGRPLTVDVPCYNEWALEKDQAVVSSVRSKGRGRGGEVRKPPYVIGKLEVQLLYVPKPKGVDDEAMPKSMKAAVREISKAGERVEVSYEGYLSQQGGDCTHWRRRFFRLQGVKLTAYHEHTNQKRAVINLSKASRLVDDRRTLVADHKAASPTKGRRKSGFAEEDEGYQYVEEGFRIRFANGETIDFYGDSKQAKDGWMEVLSQVVGKPDPHQKKASWTDAVLAREKANGAKSAQSSPAKSSPVKNECPPSSPVKQQQSEVRNTEHPKPERQLSDRKPVGAAAPRFTGQSKSVPSSPVKGPPAKRAPDPPRAAAAERPKSAIRPGTPPLEARRGHRSRNAVKSMIF